ncbi:MAG: molybdopterin cofactor-binding domain-containing protein [Collinsella sp.]
MLHMDPADLRLKNIVREGEIMPQYYNEKLNACALDRCLLRAMDMIGWRDKPLAVDLGDRVRALGCALTMQGSGISNVDIAGIDMRLEEDGFITIGTGATDNGMGVDTILAQIAAEELGVESSLIVVRGVDTDVSPFDAGSYASSGTYVTGLAAKNAATELREKICAKAAQMWDVDAADVVFDGQYVRLSDERAAASRTAISRCATLPTCASRTSRAATRSPRMPLPACPYRLRRSWPALPRSRSTRPPAR